MNYSELTKLYPQFKIPYEAEADYYINVLIWQNPDLEAIYNDVADLCEKFSDPFTHKKESWERIIEHFKNHRWDLSVPETEDLKRGYTTKDFNDYQDGVQYYSVDLREANWQAFCKYFNISYVPFKEFVITNFPNIHSALYNSKSFRQYLFGNTNPKRLQQIQYGMMKDVCDFFEETKMFNVLAKRSDELILQVVLPPDEYRPDKERALREHLLFYAYMHTLQRKFNLHLKVTPFKCELIKNFGESVRLRHIYRTGFYNILDSYKEITEPLSTELLAVSGNRFFIHYKTLILGESLDARDLYFVNDKFLAKWIL